MKGVPASTTLPNVKGTCIPWGRAEAPVWMSGRRQQYQTLTLHFLTQHSCEDHFGSLLRCARCLPLCCVPSASPFTAAASTSSLSPCLLPAQHPVPRQSYLCSFSGMPDLMWLEIYAKHHQFWLIFFKQGCFIFSMLLFMLGSSSLQIPEEPHFISFYMHSYKPSFATIAAKMSQEFTWPYAN